jgi:putative CocE/NonD family hydrolase
MRALDHDRRKDVAAYPYFSDPHFAGPAPVSDDSDGALLALALDEHKANVSIADFIHEFPCSDSSLPYDENFTPRSFSPHAYSAGNNSDLAVLSISGWMDGGYMNGSIARFLTLAGEKDRLLLGPWDHGARINVSPFREQAEPQFSLLGEILRFFDEHVQQRDTGLEQEARVHYFSFASERWKSADTWPPTQSHARTFHLAGQGELILSAGPEESVSYKPDFGFGTGQNTRYGRLAALDIRDYYGSWEARSEKLLRFEGEPVEEDITLTGTPIVTLMLESDQADAAAIVYLEDIAPDGKRLYITEGILRALHRKESAPPETYKAYWPYHSCLQADAAPLVPGEPAQMRIAMLPTSWCFRAGHKIAFCISGADKDNYILIPYGRPGHWTIHVGGAEGSTLELPLE